MNLPWFGTLGKKRMHVSGYSNCTGFQLAIVQEGDENGLGLEFTYKFTCPRESFKPQNDRRRAPMRIALMGGVMLYAIFLFFGTLLEDTDSILIYIFALTLNWLLAIGWTGALCTLIDMRFFLPELLEWHAVEHKCAALLESGEPATYDSLLRMPAVLYRCGTSVMIFSLEMASSVWFLTLFSFALIDVSALWCGVAAIILMSAVAARSLMGIDFPYFPVTRKWQLALVALPASLLPYLFERFLALKKPPEKKLRIAAKELSIFLEATGLVQIK